MSELALKIVPIEPVMKLDLGCGQSPREGFEGVDLYADAKHKVNLFRLPWPFEDDSVDEIHCSHFVEHLPKDFVDAFGRRVEHDSDEMATARDRFFAFFDECYRILKPKGTMTVITPALQSVRSFQDPTHRDWIPAERYLYLSAEWRKLNKLDHYRVSSNFGVNVNPTVQPAEMLRHSQVGANRMRELWNVAVDFHAVLTAIKP